MCREPWAAGKLHPLVVGESQRNGQKSYLITSDGRPVCVPCCPQPFTFSNQRAPHLTCTWNSDRAMAYLRNSAICCPSVGRMRTHSVEKMALPQSGTVRLFCTEKRVCSSLHGGIQTCPRVDRRLSQAPFMNRTERWGLQLFEEVSQGIPSASQCTAFQARMLSKNMVLTSSNGLASSIASYRELLPRKSF